MLQLVQICTYVGRPNKYYMYNRRSNLQEQESRRRVADDRLLVLRFRHPRVTTLSVLPVSHNLAYPETNKVAESYTYAGVAKQLVT